MAPEIIVRPVAAKIELMVEWAVPQFEIL